MAAPRYVTIQELNAWWRSETTIDEATKLGALLAAEERVDKALGRRMAVASGSTARRYAPTRCTDLLWIHDCTGVTTVTESGTTLTVDVDYQLEPLNGLTVWGASVPYTALRRLDSKWYWDAGRYTVSVTAAWGWSAIPELVKEGCKVAAKAILQGRDVSLGVAAAVESGAITERDGKTWLDMIATWRGPQSFGIA
jgi:hypothetical protein